ncbi:MAG: 30S ribosome-binding factor RbfA [Puniceicoccales bacterium]|jgi:ribosome-binding factor A|nr:30S ribosome-binding factor RbfA [Puniceicoccales bacterium]
MSLRLNRVNEAIEHEINRVLRTYFREEAFCVTIVGTLVSADFKFVQVKFSVIGNDEVCRRMVKFFRKYKNFIQQKLNEKMQFRYAPELKFEMTDAIAHGNCMINLLNIISETEG